MLPIGARAPDFTAHHEDGHTTSLAELLAGGPVVLFFYPADFTPVCTRQACMFRDIHPELVAAGLRVIGISGQGDGSHQAFRQRHDLPFPLLPDKDGTIAALYGATRRLGPPRRLTYLIDADGTVVDHLSADVLVGRHEAFARRAIQRFGRTAPR